MLESEGVAVCISDRAGTGIEEVFTIGGTVYSSSLTYSNSNRDNTSQP
jgi:hypothetical protein